MKEAITMNNSITAAEVLADGKVVLVPVSVPMPSGRVVALVTVVATLGVFAAALAYTAGRDDGERAERKRLSEAFEARVRAVQERADAWVEEIRRERSHRHQPEART